MARIAISSFPRRQLPGGNRFLGYALALLALLPGSVGAQDVEGVLRTLAGENGQLYLQPLTRGFGSAMNGGFVSGAGVHGTLEIDLGVRIVAARFSDDDTMFSPVLPSSVSFQGQSYANPFGSSAPTPTAIGEGPGTVFEPAGSFRSALVNAGEDPADFALRFPEGFDMPAAPFAALQGTIGLALGTELILRYVPEITVDDDIGSADAFGWGLKHSLDQYLPGLPFRLAAYTGWQNVDVGRYLHAESWSYGAVADVGTGPLRLFGTFGFEESDLDITYEIENPDGTPGIPADGTAIGFRESLERRSRIGGGLTLGLGPLQLSAEYASAEFGSLAVFLGFALH